MMKKPANIDEYIAGFPAETQALLQQFRETVKEVAPGATEMISYAIPAFKLDNMLVWFAAHTNHIGFYPRASAIEKFKKELSEYKGAKGSVQFPMDKPLPVGLIKQIVQFRMLENMQKIKVKKSKATGVI
jgi:uncharacterized protein YdhG (YjbR/CyaY superfamily)